MGFVELDLCRFARRQHFDYFRQLAWPYVGVTVEVDVTDYFAFCKAHHLSFYLLFVHATAKAANRIPELRMRIRDGGIILYDACPTSHTELAEDGTYGYCTLYHEMPLSAYVTDAEERRRRCRESPSLQEDEEVESMYFISTLPWFHYTALIQPVAGGDESNPRITWGKIEERDGRKMIPVSLLAHHALVDGVHLGAFYSQLSDVMREMIDEGRSSL